MTNPTRPTTGGDDLVRAAAANLAAWHDSSIRALGLESRTGEAWWTCALPAPGIYHSAISLQPVRGARNSHGRPGRLATRRHASELRELLGDEQAAYQSICDSWNELDLGRQGLSRRAVAPWFARPPGPIPTATATPTGEGAPLRIETVVDRDSLLAFEQTMTRAFEVPVLIPPFGVHAPPILDDPAMHVLLGHAGDEAVAVAMAYEGNGVLGVYGVGTVPAQRRAGYATAMMRAVLAIAPELPTTLQPSPMAQPLYRSLGFDDIGTFAHWV